MIDINHLLIQIAKQRPVFHSEADFQHAFAWKLHEQFPEAAIRLEFPLLQSNQQIHLDVWANVNQKVIAIELKYKTRGLTTVIGDERFSLKDQSAQDQGRYDFLRDIQRIERITSNRENTSGYAILLTNDSSYWKPTTSNHPVDENFRLHEGRIVQGLLAWGEKASAKTKERREEPIKLSKVYALQWAKYSDLNRASYSEFRYLVTQIT